MRKDSSRKTSSPPRPFATTGKLLASDAVLRRAGEEEAAHWVVRRQLLLRGRDRRTGVAEPRRPLEAAGERTPATLTPAVGT